MNKLLDKAVKLLDSIVSEQLKVDSTERKYSVSNINPSLLDDINVFLDDYYAEVSFLNENFSKVINGELEGYITIHFKSYPYKIRTTSLDGRVYEAKYKREGEELIIVQPFKEV